MKVFMILLVLMVSATMAACTAGRTPEPATTQTGTAPASAASSASAKVSAKLITPEEAKGRLDSEPGIVLLDVREPDEYAEGHIKGSVLLPLGDIEAKAEVTMPDKDTVVFVYCRSGRRSAIAAGQLVQMGYTQVYDLGGIIDWPYEVEK